MLKAGFSPAKAKRFEEVPNSLNGSQIRLVNPPSYTMTVDPEELYPFRLEKEGRKYLSSRGIKTEHLESWSGIVYEPYLRRILFPWYDRKILRAVTGRTIDSDETAKTLPMFGSQKGHFLYLPMREIGHSTPLILVEGEIDALKVAQAGYWNVAALGFGTMTRNQAKLIADTVSTSVRIFFDDDSAGHDLTRRVVKTLSSLGVSVSAVDWEKMRERLHPSDEPYDPANLRPNEIRMMLREAKQNVDFPTL